MLDKAMLSHEQSRVAQTFMSTTMHSRDHARVIASHVAKFKKGVFEDEIRFHTCGSCGEPLRVRNQVSYLKF